VEIPAPANAWRELHEDFPRGGRYAVVSGNPHAGGAFIMRIELPAGFELSPRRAQRDLQLVVLSGEMTVGRGASATTMKSGYFASFGAGETYSVTTAHGVALQVFSTGPWKG
jgi:quercetin dioxygenase-like cupin family protein